MRGTLSIMSLSVMNLFASNHRIPRSTVPFTLCALFAFAPAVLGSGVVTNLTQAKGSLNPEALETPIGNYGRPPGR